MVSNYGSVPIWSGALYIKAWCVSTSASPHFRLSGHLILGQISGVRSQKNHTKMPNFVPHDGVDIAAPKRYITTHDAEGRSVFEKSVDPNLNWVDVCEVATKNAQFSVGYVTKDFPVDLDEGRDLDFYKKCEEDGISVTMPNGIVMRIVDLLPGTTSPMHRTTSIDYGIVLKGQVEAILDSGETVLLNEHDILVQRATMHAWRNVSTTERARMIYFLSSAQPLKRNGEIVREDLGDIQGVPRNE